MDTTKTMHQNTESSALTVSLQPWADLLWMSLTTLGLLLLTETLRSAPCWLVPLLIVVPAYPVWLAQRESFLFDRRLLLTGATVDESLVRRWFWKGQIGSILRVPLALIMTTLLLASSVRLTALHWLVLFVDAGVLAWGYRWFQRRAAHEVRPELLGVFVRRWPLWLTNLGLLTLAFFVLSFFVLGAPDLRQSNWHLAAELAFQTQGQTLACPWAGWVSGGLAALDQGLWALAQQYIPDLPDRGLRAAAWSLLLLQVGLFSLALTSLQLGVLSLVESRAIRLESVTGESTLAKTFIATILVLAMPFLYAALKLRDLDLQHLDPPTITALNWIDPCRGQAQSNHQMQSALKESVAAARESMTQQTDRRIEREVDLLFAPVEMGVDNYLDWYFTVIGEYERLAVLIAGDFPQYMGDQLAARLFESTDFQARLEQIDQGLMADTLADLSRLSQEIKDQLAAQTQAQPCASVSMQTGPLAHLERDLWRAGAAGTSGAVTGVATVVISKKVVATVVAKVGAKKSVQAAMAMAVKMAAKKGSGTLAAALGGAALCAPSGPYAIVCGIGAGLVTWLAVDKVAIEIDETVSRDEMRADILDALAEEKANLKGALQGRHESLIGSMARDLQTTVDGVFIPARDGL
ncbi:hypothetical protein G3480_21950 [Thiorhodococcus mannitoliphagus]|uniref:Uncharacterized protein n=1 Tax=Thiorhodococcus mannitoliphagus TaxID=329406 RepID=A0A6P1E362_9GAMM|nr:hypothetical protein [Thiorhodococcus mannitoliphagus]NEX22932.1 hypothetical protein [Thiorhodococcus mannitoliphagus]